MTTLRLLLLLGAPVVRRIEPGAPVARSERLKHPLDLLPGRRAADQAICGDPLLDLEGRAILTAVHVHGHGQRLRSETGPAPQSIPFASRVRCLVALGAGRRRTALGPESWPQGQPRLHPTLTRAGASDFRRSISPTLEAAHAKAPTGSTQRRGMTCVAAGSPPSRAP